MFISKLFNRKQTHKISNNPFAKVNKEPEIKIENNDRVVKAVQSRDFKNLAYQVRILEKLEQAGTLGKRLDVAA